MLNAVVREELFETSEILAQSEECQHTACVVAIKCTRAVCLAIGDLAATVYQVNETLRDERFRANGG